MFYSLINILVGIIDDSLIKFWNTVGGTGFVAGHLIQQLLQRGYRVRATLRDDVYAQSELFAYLSRLQMASELLEVVPLDLSTPSGDSTWEAAFVDVEYVMHVASPVILHDTDPESNIINPIVIGTQTVVQYCQNSSTVKKLILTSCMSAMTDVFETGKKYDESCWNETATPTHSIYSYSKTSAEREAHRVAMETNATFQLVSILPGTILGAHLGKKMSQSHHFFQNVSMRNGKNRGVINMSLAISDVRDVARFHIASLERESNEPVERFLCANVALPMERILQIIHENFDDINVPTRKVSEKLHYSVLFYFPVICWLYFYFYIFCFMLGFIVCFVFVHNASGVGYFGESSSTPNANRIKK